MIACCLNIRRWLSVYIIDIHKYTLFLIKQNSNVENIVFKDTNDYLGDTTILNLKT